MHPAPPAFVLHEIPDLEMVHCCEGPTESQHTDPCHTVPDLQAQNTEKGVRSVSCLLICVPRGPIKPILKLCFNIFRSVMFLTTFVGSILAMNELSHHLLRGKVSFYRRNCAIAFLATGGIACEQPHRRVDITYYVMPRSLEIIWEMLKNRRLVRDIPGQNVSQGNF